MTHKAFPIKRVEIKLLVPLAEDVIRITIDTQLKIDFLDWKGLLNLDVVVSHAT